MAKKGKGGIRRAARRAKAVMRRATPRGGRLSVMFKTALAVGAAALVGGAALNTINAARTKPIEGFGGGVVTGGAGLALAFLLGLFKGTRQYVTPVLAGAAAVGTLTAAAGPLQRGSMNIAKMLLGEKAGDKLASGGGAGGGGPKGLSNTGGGATKTVKPNKLSQALGIGEQLANIGLTIAQNVRGGAAPAQGLTAGQRAVAAAAGLDDITIGGAGDDDDDLDGAGDEFDIGGSEGLDDFAVVGSALMGDDD